MAFAKRRMDRAQRTRARRVWWERHGPFARGLLVGALITIGVLGLGRVFGLL
jgi:hypothetical protein